MGSAARADRIRYPATSGATAKLQNDDLERMNHEKTISILCGILCIVLTAAPVREVSPEESLRKSFPTLRADSIRPSGVNDLYEVVSGNRILLGADIPRMERILGNKK